MGFSQPFRQIELANAARNRGTIPYAHQPFILAQVLADLALHGQQRRRRLFDFVKGTGKRLFRDFGIIAKRKENLSLSLQFLDKIELEIGAAGDFEDLEQRHQGHMVLGRAVCGRKMRYSVENILKAQQSANALAEGIFVGDHGRAQVNSGNSDRIDRKSQPVPASRLSRSARET
jgi:hypothetical protein